MENQSRKSFNTTSSNLFENDYHIQEFFKNTVQLEPINDYLPLSNYNDILLPNRFGLNLGSDSKVIVK